MAIGVTVVVEQKGQVQVVENGSGPCHCAALLRVDCLLSTLMAYVPHSCLGNRPSFTMTSGVRAEYQKPSPKCWLKDRFESKPYYRHSQATSRAERESKSHLFGWSAMLMEQQRTQNRIWPDGIQSDK